MHFLGIARQLTQQAQTIRALATGVTAEQARWAAEIASALPAFVATLTRRFTQTPGRALLGLRGALRAPALTSLRAGL